MTFSFLFRKFLANFNSFFLGLLTTELQTLKHVTFSSVCVYMNHYLIDNSYRVKVDPSVI